MLWIAPNNKKFGCVDNKNKSNIIFVLKEGQQQGAVNSPILFIIYMSDMLSLFGLNSDENNNKKLPPLKAVAFADDVILYVINRNLDIVKEGLQKIFRLIIEYHNTWNLKINLAKCETFLFRPNTVQMHKKFALVWRDLG